MLLVETFPRRATLSGRLETWTMARPWLMLMVSLLHYYLIMKHLGMQYCRGLFLLSETGQAQLVDIFYFYVQSLIYRAVCSHARHLVDLKQVQSVYYFINTSTLVANTLIYFSLQPGFAVQRVTRHLDHCCLTVIDALAQKLTTVPRSNENCQIPKQAYTQCMNYNFYLQISSK